MLYDSANISLSYLSGCIVKLKGTIPVCPTSLGAPPVMADASDFATEPTYKNKFKASRVKDIISGVLKSRLTGAVYHADNTSSWAREIADEIKQKLKAEGWSRYKYAVQVFIGEQRGEGVRLACRGFWDAKTDSYAHETFQNVSRNSGDSNVVRFLVARAGRSIAAALLLRRKHFFV